MSSSIEQLTKLRSFPFTMHTFHDFFSKSFVLITPTAKPFLHRGTNSSNWIQNNRVSISWIGAHKCLHTSAIALSRYAIKQEIVLYIFATGYLPYLSLSRFLSRLASILPTNPIDPSFSPSRDRLSITFDIPLIVQ